MTRRAPAIAFTIALAAAACSGGSDDPASREPGGDGESGEGEAPASEPATEEPEGGQFSATVRPSAEQVVVTGAEPGQGLTLDGPTTLLVSADDLGNAIFRDVLPGDGYTVTSPTGVSEPFRVMAFTDHPDDAFYAAQELDGGFGYIETRDGTLLAAMVRLPGPIEDGPYPTVVEYSGYTPSDPDSPQPAMGLAAQLGYATVGINMRGTGCSGGAFDFFEPLQSLDGYDAIEVIARQPWVAGGQVGMVGLSYPGISQLFVAQYRPPGLKAITPMSVIEDTYRSTLYPGGILNVGFAKSWADDRQDSAQPLAADYARARVEAGDQICEANQSLRSQTIDLESETRASGFYRPEVVDQIAPRTFVDRIDVPVFLAGQWQDEQTGSRFATMIDDFTGTDVLRVHLANGAHADGFGPDVLHRWSEFLDFYVKEEIPEFPASLRALVPIGYADLFGVPMELPADRFGEYTDFESALAAYEAEAPVLLLVENGGDPDELGGPSPRSTLIFDAWPPPEAEPLAWVLTDDGLDADVVPSPLESPLTFVPDPSEGSVVTAPVDDDAGFAHLEWPLSREGASVSWTSAPLADDMLLAGTGVVALELQTRASDVDVEVTISEIRPDGTEVYVQSGWLRASHREIDTTVDDVPSIWHSHLEADAQAIDGTALLRIELFPVAHPFRAGSRIRLTVDTPGGSRPEWKFEVLDTTEPVSILQGGLELPMVTDVPLPPGYPPCSPGLRSQPCRSGP